MRSLSLSECATWADSCSYQAIDGLFQGFGMARALYRFAYGVLVLGLFVGFVCHGLRIHLLMRRIDTDTFVTRHSPAFLLVGYKLSVLQGGAVVQIVRSGAYFRLVSLSSANGDARILTGKSAVGRNPSTSLSRLQHPSTCR
jgi:hypothetical protein